VYTLQAAIEPPPLMDCPALAETHMVPEVECSQMIF
jgi:hypothetical protein